MEEFEKYRGELLSDDYLAKPINNITKGDFVSPDDAIQLTNGDIRVDWKLYNGVSGSIADLKSFLLNNNLIIPFLALSCGYSPFDLDPIDGTLTLSRGSNGVWRLKQLNRDPYPSLGVYQYQNGNLVKIIIERNEWPSGQPDVGLRPEAPNDVYP